MEYSYWNRYHPGAMRLEDKMAILFTTAVQFVTGILSGEVTDYATGRPIEGARVTASLGFFTFTDENGEYEIDDIFNRWGNFVDSLLQPFAGYGAYDLEYYNGYIWRLAHYDNHYVYRLDPESYEIVDSLVVLDGINSLRNTTIDLATGHIYTSSKINRIPVSLEVGQFSIPKEAGMPLDWSLAQNYPNPFNSSTGIGYSLKQAGTA